MNRRDFLRVANIAVLTGWLGSKVKQESISSGIQADIDKYGWDGFEEQAEFTEEQVELIFAGERLIIDS